MNFFYFPKKSYSYQYPTFEPNTYIKRREKTKMSDKNYQNPHLLRNNHCRWNNPNTLYTVLVYGTCTLDVRECLHKCCSVSSLYTFYCTNHMMHLKYILYMRYIGYIVHECYTEPRFCSPSFSNRIWIKIVKSINDNII